ncbi:MFS transporter [Kitasatospora sp. NBC_01287]|uniref:MFS transporter n=1 Tax=Kitasatospora sp. NBC_01287 TaxID=2903573 RepID=UPI00225A021C|nr:MFS transporter [Kitasatospora sp. NBC_01287]MCX4743956.1 MFS transporter [Kitasatospora sp. NBC_01287]
MSGPLTEDAADAEDAEDAEDAADAREAGRASSLWRNRDFNLLWTGQCLSDVGSAMSDLALPLLVFQLTGSPTQAGLVGTAGLAVATTCRLPAGVLVDRFDRRRLMILCDVVRLVVYAALACAVVAGKATLALILVVVAGSAAASVVFTTAEFAAVRSLVRPDQLVTAVARNEARSYGSSLAGPPLGGLLFGLGRALPFLGNALSFLLSLSALLCIRRPLQQPRPDPASDPASVPASVPGGTWWQGPRFVLGNPFLRSLIVIAAPLNMAFTGMIFALTISLRRSGLPPVLVGLVTMTIGVGGLLGAFTAPALQRRLRLPTLIRVICWSTAALMALSVLLSTGIAAAVPLAVAVFLGPAANAALFGYQAAVTPDHLQGRVVSVVLLAATSATALAPALAGVLLSHVAGRTAMLAFPLLVVAAAVVATFGGGIRSMSRRP